MLVAEWDRPFPRPPGPDNAWGALYTTHPGDIVMTMRAVDAAGNRSAFSNAVTALDVHGC